MEHSACDRNTAADVRAAGRRLLTTGLHGNILTSHAFRHCERVNAVISNGLDDIQGHLARFPKLDSRHRITQIGRAHV